MCSRYHQIDVRTEVSLDTKDEYAWRKLKSPPTLTGKRGRTLLSNLPVWPIAQPHFIYGKYLWQGVLLLPGLAGLLAYLP